METRELGRFGGRLQERRLGFSRRKWHRQVRRVPELLDSVPLSRLLRSPFWVTAIGVYGAWCLYMLSTSHFSLFVRDWYMAVTMVFGSFIAGSTAAGGGAVAFPVMTLAFQVEPGCARNFSLAIQSVGMSAAAITILLSGIRVERRALVYASGGGAVGIVLGTFFAVPLFTQPAFTKMFFSSLWLSFALSLFLINLDRSRNVNDEIANFRPRRDGAVLAGVGALGGIVTSLTGSGLDIVTFSLLCLLYGVSEKVATPTSVVLMAWNSIVGFALHLSLLSAPADGVPYWHGDFHLEARDFWLVSIPVVVLGAPAGARFIRNKSRTFVATLLYAAIVLQFAAAWFVLRPEGWLAGFSALVFGAGAGLFLLLAFLGRRPMRPAKGGQGYPGRPASLSLRGDSDRWP